MIVAFGLLVTSCSALVINSNNHVHGLAIDKMSEVTGAMKDIQVTVAPDPNRTTGSEMVGRPAMVTAGEAFRKHDVQNGRSATQTRMSSDVMMPASDQLLLQANHVSNVVPAALVLWSVLPTTPLVAMDVMFFSAPQHPGQLESAAKATALSVLIAAALMTLAAALIWCCRLLEGRIPTAPSVRTSNEILFTIGCATTLFHGGGIVFGFSAFADALLELPGSPFTVNTISVVFAVGHMITAFGCVISGVLLDYTGPRFCAVSGLFIESAGFLMLADLTHMAPTIIMVAYGLIGWGGCLVFLAALTFATAFQQNQFLCNSMLTAAFDGSALLFMVLAYVKWESFFFTYGIICLIMALVTLLLYPCSTLSSMTGEGTDASESSANTTGPAAYLRSMKNAFTPGMTCFMVTFMIASSALIYGMGEFPAAIRAKDDCIWDDAQQDFTACKGHATQDHMNTVVMPLTSFTLPVGMLIGKLIDTYGFALPAAINISSVQVFLAALWLFDLNGQYLTLMLYNIAASAVWTIQNAYICSASPDLIGGLFAISNIVMCTGNVIAAWLNTNPFSSGPNAVRTSLKLSCIFWIVLMFPLYVWPLVETRLALVREKSFDTGGTSKDKERTEATATADSQRTPPGV